VKHHVALLARTPASLQPGLALRSWLQETAHRSVAAARLLIGIVALKNKYKLGMRQFSATADIRT
jgi:hypothetical protein